MKEITHTLHVLHPILPNVKTKLQEIEMKKLIFSSLVGLALVAFTGCTDGSDATASKCQSGKCQTAQKCEAGKCQAGKCKGAPAVAKCDGAKKCAASGKCGK